MCDVRSTKNVPSAAIAVLEFLSVFIFIGANALLAGSHCIAFHWSPCLVYYFLSLTLSVCPSVCLFVTNIASSFLFLDGIEPFLGHQFSMTKTTKLFFFDFWFMAPNAQNLLPKIFIRGSLSQSQSVGHRLWVNDIWARRGDPVAYRLVFLLVITYWAKLMMMKVLLYEMPFWLWWAGEYHQTGTCTCRRLLIFLD